MSETPYTDEDLRVEAAYQHALSLQDPDFMGIGERMDDDTVLSTEQGGGKTWGELLPSDHGFDTARDAIEDLIGHAADTSRWAIDLGADGLDPSTEHAITVNGDGRPIARIHFAFEPGMRDDMRAALVEGIGEAIANAL